MVDVLVQVENGLIYVTTSDICAFDRVTFSWAKKEISVPNVICFNPVGDNENLIYVFTKSHEEANNLVLLAYNTRNLDLRSYANATITIDKNLYDKEDFNEICHTVEQLYKDT